MNKRLKTFLLILTVLTIITASCSYVFAASSSKAISIVVNPVTVKFGGKIANIDSFSYSAKVYLQPQDICSRLNIDYIYDSKTKTISITDKKPLKAVMPGKANFKSVKKLTTKKINIILNSVIIRVNGKQLKAESISYNGSIYASAKDIAGALSREYNLDSKTTVLNIGNKTVKTTVPNVNQNQTTQDVKVEQKPPVPVLTQDKTDMTKGSVTITISNWGNAEKKEYCIDNGAWLTYSEPLTLSSNCKVSAKGTNKDGISSEVGAIKITNIRKLLGKTEVSEMRSGVVKIITYDINHVEVGSGSGFIVSEDGNVVTNYHVIDMAPILEVKTADNAIYQVAGVLKYDAERDIAILKLKDAESMPNMSLGDSDDLKYGEDIAAMGHPLGMSLTVTFGNISSLDSPGGLTRKEYNDIQFSAPISQGNSGGPLVNMYGDVVGINYSVMVEGQNLNYAIPINELKPMLDGLGPVKSPAAVIKEVYPEMTYNELAYYMYLNYPVYSVDGYNFNFDNFLISEYSKDPNEVDVYVQLGTEKYNELVKAEKNGGKSAAEKWCRDIYDTVKAAFPNKTVDVLICNIDFFDSKPSGYSDDEIYYDESTGEYIVVKLKLEFTIVDSTNKVQWMD